MFIFLYANNILNHLLDWITTRETFQKEIDAGLIQETILSQGKPARASSVK